MQFLSILLMIAIILFGVMTYFNLSDPVGLGIKEKKLADLPKTPNAVSSQTDEEARFVAPLPFKGDLQASMERVKAILDDMDRFFIHEESETYIHAIAVTPMMRYRDDVEFFFDEEASLIHFRSASRIGYSDKGMNRKRYEAIAKIYSR
mgnify:CR=1 FL=1